MSCERTARQPRHYMTYFVRQSFLGCSTRHQRGRECVRLATALVLTHYCVVTNVSGAGQTTCRPLLTHSTPQTTNSSTVSELTLTTSFSYTCQTTLTYRTSFASVHTTCLLVTRQNFSIMQTLSNMHKYLVREIIAVIPPPKKLHKRQPFATCFGAL